LPEIKTSQTTGQKFPKTSSNKVSAAIVPRCTSHILNYFRGLTIFKMCAYLFVTSFGNIFQLLAKLSG
jgi:hypothetical protein